MSKETFDTSISCSPCNSDNTAQCLYNKLKEEIGQNLPNINLSDDDFKIPSNKDNDLYKQIKSLKIEDLTTKVVDGTGAFDCIMTAVSSHLNQEYKQNRITGATYAETYLGAMQSTLASAVQFLLGKDQAYWQAVQIQMSARKAEIDAVVAKVQLEIAKLQYNTTLAQMKNETANFALTKMKIATEDANHCNLLTQNKLLQEQINNLVLQGNVLKENIETARAQTTNTRTDGSPITGLAGAQVTLYGAQKTAYERDTEYKFSKMLIDYWIAQKGIDEGLNPPAVLNNDYIGSVVSNTRNRIGGI